MKYFFFLELNRDQPNPVLCNILEKKTCISMQLFGVSLIRSYCHVVCQV